MATFFVIGTPIGNLGDITLRAIDALMNVDLILAEDTRVTKALLDRYNIKKPLQSYHQHSKLDKTARVIEYLAAGKNIALVSDAGTPGINDPGGMLIEEILKSGVEVKIVPIPGPNAATTALSISGFPAERFLFLGFPPNKKGRKTFFKKLADYPFTTVFYESPFRIAKALAELPAERSIVIARELTKQFETIYRGPAGNIKIDPQQLRGEFVVVVHGSR